MFLSKMTPCDPRIISFPYTTLFRSLCPRADVAERTEPVDAGVRPEVHQHDLPPQTQRREKAVLVDFWTYTCINRSEEHTSELQSHSDVVCRLLLAKKNAMRSRLGFW